MAENRGAVRDWVSNPAPAERRAAAEHALDRISGAVLALRENIRDGFLDPAGLGRIADRVAEAHADLWRLHQSAQ